MSTSTHSYDGLMLGPMLLDGRKLGLSDGFLVAAVGFLLGIDEGGSDWLLPYPTPPPHTQHASDTVCPLFVNP